MMGQRRYIRALLGAAAMLTSLLVIQPAGATPGIPPDITAIDEVDQTIDPGETRLYKVSAVGVDDPATAVFSGEGLTARITQYKKFWVRLSITADPTAAPGQRDLTITNPDGLSDAFPAAISVTQPNPPDVGDVVGRVFTDNNANGIEDGTDTGINAVTVTVIDTNTTTHTATTDTNGDYTLTALPTGSATITITDPPNHTLTTTNNPQTVTITTNTQTTATPTGYQPNPAGTLPGSYVEADVHLLLDARSLNLVDGDPVVSWIDDVAGIEFTVPGTLDAPTYLASTGFGGEPSVEFDGIDDVLEATFGELNSGDFVFQLVLETQTYKHRTAIMTQRAGAMRISKNVIGYDNYDEGGFLNGNPAWVTMSGPDGTQAQHYHPILNTAAGDDRNSPTDDPTDDANRVVLTYVVRDSGQLRFWDGLDDLMDVTMSAPGNNLDQGLRLAARENSAASTFANYRLAYLIAVDATLYTEQDMLDSVNDLANWFGVPLSDPGAN